MAEGIDSVLTLLPTLGAVDEVSGTEWHGEGRHSPVYREWQAVGGTTTLRAWQHESISETKSTMFKDTPEGAGVSMKGW